MAQNAQSNKKAQLPGLQTTSLLKSRPRRTRVAKISPAERLAFLRDETVSTPEFFEQSMQLIKQLLKVPRARDCSLRELEVRLGELYLDFEISSHIVQLFSFAAQMRTNEAVRVSFFQRKQIVERLALIAEIVQRRRYVCSRIDLAEGSNRVFDLTWQPATCTRPLPALCCGVLIQQGEQPLWIQVTAEQDGEALEVCPRFESWNPLIQGGLRLAEDRRVFCSMVPLGAPRRIPWIIDAVRVPVSLSSIKKKDSSYPIQFRLQLIDRRGRVYASEVCTVSGDSLVTEPNLLSPQATAIYPVSVSSGLELTINDPFTGVECRNGWEVFGIFVPWRCRYPGAATLRALRYETRILDSQGLSVASLSSDSERRGGGSLEITHGANDTLTFVQRGLLPSNSDSDHIFELSIVNDKGNVVCGEYAWLRPSQSSHTGLYASIQSSFAELKGCSSGYRVFRARCQLKDVRFESELVRAYGVFRGLDQSGVETLCLDEAGVVVEASSSGAEAILVFRVSELQAKRYPGCMVELVFEDLHGSIIARSEVPLTLDEVPVVVAPWISEQTRACIVGCRWKERGAGSGVALLRINALTSSRYLRLHYDLELPGGESVLALTKSSASEVGGALMECSLQLPDNSIRVAQLLAELEISSSRLRDRFSALSDRDYRLSILVFGDTGRMLQSLKLPLSSCLDE